MVPNMSDIDFKVDNLENLSRNLLCLELGKSGSLQEAPDEGRYNSEVLPAPYSPPVIRTATRGHAK